MLDSFPDAMCIGAGVGVPGPVLEQSLVRGCVNLGSRQPCLPQEHCQSVWKAVGIWPTSPPPPVAPETIRPKDVYDAAAAGDENAKRVTEEAGTALGVACAKAKRTSRQGGNTFFWNASSTGSSRARPAADPGRPGVFPV